MEAEHTDAAVAETVLVSYRAADVDADADTDAGGGDGFAEDHIVHEQIREPPFRAYLRRVHGGPVTGGDEWSEFVNCGCGTTEDVVLRVESVDGGGRLDESTAVELVSAGET